MQKYGLIGYPLGHSFSKNYFNQKFEKGDTDNLLSRIEKNVTEYLNK